MSRSRKSKFVGYGKESTVQKRKSLKKWKAECRAQMQRGRYDDLPTKKGTCGWMTW